MKLKELALTSMVAAGLLLVGCAHKSGEAASEKEVDTVDFNISMVTDQNGIDDRSFNQSAGEGMEDWVVSNNLSEESINYYQSGEEFNYIPNLNTAIQDEADIIYAIGFSLEEALIEIAAQNADQKFDL